jgi:hypothetical protein
MDEKARLRWKRTMSERELEDSGVSDVSEFVDGNLNESGNIFFCLYRRYRED